MKPRTAAAVLLLAVLLAGCQAAPEQGSIPPESSAPAETVTPAEPSEPAVPTPTEEPSPSEEPSASVHPSEAVSPERSENPAGEPSEEPSVPAEEPKDGDFVRAADYVPNLFVSLPYATSDNFTGQVIYDFQEAWLRYGTVKKLAAAAQELEEEGYALLIWDAFRPTWAQFRLWEVCPDGNFVADPTKGFSSHSRGNTVDLTLVTLDGEAVEMPSGFDEFSALADRDYGDAAPEAADHARLLEDVMARCGFRGYRAEWWHYSDTDSFPAEEEFTPPG